MLENDGPGGLVLQGVGSSAGTFTDSGEGANLLFTPPSPSFVGPATGTYAVRFRLDDRTTVRAQASVRLVYRRCVEPEVKIAGTGLNHHKDLTSLRGTLRICTDGVTASYTVKILRVTKPGLFDRAMQKLVNATIAAFTGGRVSVDLEVAWHDMASEGSSSLRGKLQQCYSIGLGNKRRDPEKLRDELRRRLGRLLGSVGGEIVGRLLDKTAGTWCDPIVSARTGAASVTGSKIRVPTVVKHQVVANVSGASLEVGRNWHDVTLERRAISSAPSTEMWSSLAWGWDRADSSPTRG